MGTGGSSVQGIGGDCVMGSCMFCTTCQIFHCNEIKVDEMGGASGMQGEKRYEPAVLVEKSSRTRSLALYV